MFSKLRELRENFRFFPFFDFAQNDSNAWRKWVNSFTVKGLRGFLLVCEKKMLWVPVWCLRGATALHHYRCCLETQSIASLQKLRKLLELRENFRFLPVSRCWPKWFNAFTVKCLSMFLLVCEKNG
jgi:hypothetical protein